MNEIDSIKFITNEDKSILKEALKKIILIFTKD